MIFDQVHSVLPLANVVVRLIILAGDVAGDADPSRILCEAGKGRFSARMCQGVVEDENDEMK